MKRLRIAMAALMLAGCGDPTLSRLPAGSSAITCDDDITLGGEGDKAVLSYSNGLGDLVPFGVAVAVIDDGAGDARSGFRKVKVRVLEGDCRDKIGGIIRKNLRAAR